MVAYHEAVSAPTVWYLCRVRSMTLRERVWLRVLLVTLCAAAALQIPAVRHHAREAVRTMRGRHTVAQRVAQYGPAARARLQPSFERAGVRYPPRDVTLLAVKDTGELLVYAAGPDGVLHLVRRMLIVAQSGVAGPKLREGDRQVPEGFYGIDSLNPDSLYHLALRVNYPTDDDRARAREDDRSELGGDIMIHGSSASVGCLAMGDEGAEDLFVLAAESGIERVRVWIVPTDFRRNPAWRAPEGLPAWVDARYRRLREALATLP